MIERGIRPFLNQTITCREALMKLSTETGNDIVIHKRRVNTAQGEHEIAEYVLMGTNFNGS